VAQVPNITNITPPRVPLTDPRTGLISREWYLFLLSLFNQTGGSLVSLEDVQKGPPGETVDANALLSAAQLSSGVLPSDLGPIITALQALEVSQRAAFDPTNLQNSIQALELAPANTPQLPRLRYGSFCDTTTQTAAAINTAYAMTFNTTEISNGVYVGSPTSRIYTDTHNVYNLQFSAQLDKTSGGVGLAWFWLRKNGVDVPNSAGQVRIQGNDAELVVAWNYLVELGAGDYIELMWEVDTTDIQLLYEAATAVHPAVPSVILTVTDNISS
jgi:hypothetical protein